MNMTSWKLGRIAGIDLLVHPTFLMILLWASTWPGSVTNNLLVVTLVFGCVVLHELGHALMARRYGIGTADITIMPLGGIARLERMPKSAGPELAIALAGPAVNVAIAGVLGAVLAIVGPWVDETYLGTLAFQMMWINVGLLVFNMLPIFPMDGGRVLRALLSGWLGRFKATTIAANLGRGIALVAGTYLLFTRGLTIQVFLAVFIFVAASMELRGVRLEEARKRELEDWPTPPPGYRWVDRGDGVWKLAPVVVGLGTFHKVGRPWG